MTDLNRKLKPRSNGSIDFSIPEINHFKLSNGLRVYHVHKNKLPITKLNLIIPAGSKFDAYGLEGISFLTSLLVDEGTKKLNALEFDNEVDKLGSSLDVSTSVDHVFISLLSMEEHFERSLELFSLILKEPRFDNESFEREKKKHLTKIIQSFDDPSYLAANAFQKNLFKSTYYETPTLGYANSVMSVKNSDVKDFNRKFYNSENTLLVVVSSLDKEHIKSKLEKYLSGWEIKNSVDDTRFTLKTNKPKIFFINKEGAAQSEIAAGHLLPKRNEIDYFPVTLANAILGGQFSSRINLNLREDKGYTYGASSSINFNKEIGYFSVSTSVQSEYTLQSVFEIDKEIRRIREDVSEEEVNFVKSYLVKRFPSLFETYSQFAQRLSSKVIYDLPEDYFDTYIDNISSKSRFDIQEAAIKYFLPDLTQYFVVGNKELIWDELVGNDKFEVVELDKFGNLLS